MTEIAREGLFLPPQEKPDRDLRAGREHLLVNRGFMKFLNGIPHPAALLTPDGLRLVLANQRMSWQLGASHDEEWIGAELNRPSVGEVLSTWRLRLRHVEIRGRGYRLLTVVPARVLEEVGS